MTEDGWGRAVLQQFFMQTRSLEPCIQVWCRSCYVTLDRNEFLVARPIDEGGIELQEEADQLRFLKGRDGDHLVTPFQCDLCHFQNIMDRDPEKLIRRANLDALWAREWSALPCRQDGKEQVLQHHWSSRRNCLSPWDLSHWKIHLEWEPLLSCYSLRFAQAKMTHWSTSEQ